MPLTTDTQTFAVSKTCVFVCIAFHCFTWIRMFQFKEVPPGLLHLLKSIVGTMINETVAVNIVNFPYRIPLITCSIINY